MTPEEIAALEEQKKKFLATGDYVPKSEIDHILGDVQKEKKAKKAAEDKLAALEKKASDEEKLKLTEKQQFEELYNKEKTRADDLEARDQKRSDNLSAYLKNAALKDAALKLGLKPESVEDLKFIGLKDVEVEITTKEDGSSDIKVLNADKVAERIKQIRPHWFGSKKSPKLNVDDPGVVDMYAVTMKQVQDAEAKASKSGDPDDAESYKKLLIAYRDQSRGRR